MVLEDKLLTGCTLCFLQTIATTIKCLCQAVTRPLATNSEGESPSTACAGSVTTHMTIKTVTQLNALCAHAAHVDTEFYLGWEVCPLQILAAIQRSIVSPEQCAANCLLSICII